jgi:hypothetical protein
MAVESVRRSDKSSSVIPEGTGARVRVMFLSDGRPDMRADLTDAEVKKLIAEYGLKEVATRSRG